MGIYGGGAGGSMPAAGRGCRPSGAARGRRRAGSKGWGRKRQGRAGKGRHGAREAAKRRRGKACPRRPRNIPKGEREGPTGKAAAKAKGGACAVPLHGEALGKRKAPHGAGLIGEGISRRLFTGGELEAAQPVKKSGKPAKILTTQTP